MVSNVKSPTRRQQKRDCLKKVGGGGDRTHEKKKKNPEKTSPARTLTRTHMEREESADQRIIADTQLRKYRDGGDDLGCSHGVGSESSALVSCC